MEPEKFTLSQALTVIASRVGYAAEADRVGVLDALVRHADALDQLGADDEDQDDEPEPVKAPPAKKTTRARRR